MLMVLCNSGLLKKINFKAIHRLMKQIYQPGFNLYRPLTSRRLIKAGDRAHEALYLKKFVVNIT